MVSDAMEISVIIIKHFLIGPSVNQWIYEKNEKNIILILTNCTAVNNH